jgi:hypothetical protein
MGTGTSGRHGDLFQQLKGDIRFRVPQVKLANFPRLRA